MSALNNSVDGTVLSSAADVFILSFPIVVGKEYREYNPDSAGTRRDELSSGRLTRLVLDRW